MEFEVGIISGNREVKIISGKYGIELNVRSNENQSVGLTLDEEMLDIIKQTIVKYYDEKDKPF